MTCTFNLNQPSWLTKAGVLKDKCHFWQMPKYHPIQGYFSQGQLIDISWSCFPWNWQQFPYFSVGNNEQQKPDKLCSSIWRSDQFSGVYMRLTDKMVIPIYSLWASEAIWRQRSGSLLAHIIAGCLTALSHYLNQYWLAINEAHWQSPVANFIRNDSSINY